MNTDGRFRWCAPLVIAATLLFAVLAAQHAMAAQPAADVGASSVDAPPLEDPPVEADKQTSASQVRAGESFTYTIQITNTAVVTPLSVIMTDTLPAVVALAPDSLQALHGTASYSGNVVTWSGVLTQGEPISVTFQVRALQGDSTVTNTAQVDAGAYGLINTPPVSTQVEGAIAYLPYVATREVAIYGSVVVNGAAAPDVLLELRRYAGGSWSTQSSTTTAADGTFSFRDMPPLGPGQRYYVRYLAPAGATNRLSYWFTRQLRSYADQAVNIGNFDIADVELRTPATGSTVKLPHSFRWFRRVSAVTDSYEFNLLDPNDGNPWFFTRPLLGYVEEYTLSSVPAGFSPNVFYWWEMWVYSPDGGMGHSGTGRWVRFTDGNASAAEQPMQPPPALPAAIPQDWPAP